MVLQPHLAAATALLALVACGKGPGPTHSTPPDDDGGGTTAETGHHTPTGDDGSSSEPRPADEEELRIDGVRLRLQPGSCQLSATFLDEALEHRFESFPGPCHFAASAEGPPWVVATDHGKAVLVQSSAKTEGNDCDTALQIVVITERGPQLSRQVQRISSCGPGPWDEMMYHVLASDRVAFGAR